MQLAEDQIMYVQMYGRAVRLTAICLGDDTANQHMLAHPDDGLIAQFGELRLIAKMSDYVIPR